MAGNTTRIIPKLRRDTAVDVSADPSTTGFIRVTAINVHGGDGLTRRTTRSTSARLSLTEAGQLVTALIESGAIVESATMAPHDCGLCDSPLTFAGVEGGYDTWTCPACGWWHIARACCSPNAEAEADPHFAAMDPHRSPRMKEVS